MTCLQVFPTENRLPGKREFGQKLNARQPSVELATISFANEVDLVTTPSWKHNRETQVEPKLVSKEESTQTEQAQDRRRHVSILAFEQEEDEVEYEQEAADDRKPRSSWWRDGGFRRVLADFFYQVLGVRPQRETASKEPKRYDLRRPHELYRRSAKLCFLATEEEERWDCVNRRIYLAGEGQLRGARVDSVLRPAGLENEQEAEHWKCLHKRMRTRQLSSPLTCA